MKKNAIYALMSAIALTGAVGFSSCSSSSSEEVFNNPDYNPESNMVKTEFTISLPANVAGKSETRMLSTDVQNAGYTDFRGMTGIYLLPFAATVTSDNVSATSINGSPIQLGDIVKGDPAASSNEEQLNNAANNSVVYEDVSVQTGTSSFIFYARAGGEAATRDQADKFKLGSLDAGTISSTMTNVNGVQLALESITTSTAQCAGSAKGSAIVTLLNDIAGTTDNSATPVKWEDAPESSLAGLFTIFTSIKAGSSKTIEAALGKLYATLKTYSDGTSGSGNASNKQIADNIRSKISAACSTAPAAEATTITLKSDYQGYPADVYLPDGVARVNWDATTSQFKGVSSTDANNGNFALPSAYTYPASLYYWTNSSLVAANAKKSNEYSTKTTWADVVSTADGGVYKDGTTSVSSSTRSIALVNQIQYAVGRLDTYVKIGGTGTDLVTLKDNEETTVNVPTDGFVLTGVLVGEQHQVGWNFEPKTSTAQSTIYDRDVVSGITAKTTDLSGPNYTLVLESPANDNINVALEFQNGDQEFKGADGYIPAGSKFYLLADLKPALSTADPAGNADDPTKTGGKVFKQDFKTIANFTIGANSLKKAYNTLPDLRKPDLELGLSVDLEWQQGITFNVEF